MWTREQLKTNAKSCLSRYYWMAVLTLVIYSILSSAVTGMVGGIFFGISSIFSGIGTGMMSGASDEAVYALIPLAIVFFTISFIIGIASNLLIGSFILYPMTVGVNKYFMRGRYGKGKIEDIFHALSCGKYSNIAKSSFFMYLYIMLWSLLFVIPGIIKSYEYGLVLYIMAENPSISKDRAFEISKKTMDGEKWNRFVLDLSFIGWYLLALLTMGIGFIFLLPYVQATYAEFYACMREKALAQGIASKEELIGFEA